MKSLYNIFLFLGDHKKNWSPFLRDNVKGFLNDRIYFYPKKVLQQLNYILNLLYVAVVKYNSVIWLVDNTLTYKKLINTHNKDLLSLNVFYITESLPKGFLTNSQCLNYKKFKKPAIVIFTNFKSSDKSLLRDVKNLGVITIGFSNNFVKNLDYIIYSRNKEFFLLVLAFLLSIKNSKSLKKDVLSLKNYFENEKIKT